MADRWLDLRLGDVARKIGSGATPKGGKEAYLDQGPFALIRSQNVYNDHFSFPGLAYINDEQARALSNVAVEPADVLLNITGDSVARCAQVDPSVLPARVNQHVAIVRTDPSRLDARFLRYYLISPPVQQHLHQLASAGATRPALTKAMLESLSIFAPASVDEQHVIASILGALDDKIELNRKMSATLEAIARALFKSWFVDFDTDVSAKDWTAVPLSELLSLQYGKALKEEFRIPGPVAVMGCTGQVGWHDKSLSTGPGIVVGRKGANAGTVSWVDGDFWVIDTAFYVAAKNVRHLPFLYYALQLQELSSLQADSAVPGINRDAVHQRLQIMPPENMLSLFSDSVSPMIRRIASAATESRTLTTLRDALLPKLISGELRVADAERILEKSA